MYRDRRTEIPLCLPVRRFLEIACALAQSGQDAQQRCEVVIGQTGLAEHRFVQPVGRGQRQLVPLGSELDQGGAPIGGMRRATDQPDLLEPVDGVGHARRVHLQARAALEGATIVLATSRMTDETIAALRQILNTMQREIEAGRKPLDQDRLFHVTIAEQSGNSVLARMVANLFDERHSPISAQLRVKFEDRDTWTHALQEHEAILAALELKDPLLAQAAMHTHLEGSKRRWVEN